MPFRFSGEFDSRGNFFCPPICKLNVAYFAALSLPLPLRLSSILMKCPEVALSLPLPMELLSLWEGVITDHECSAFLLSTKRLFSAIYLLSKGGAETCPSLLHTTVSRRSPPRLWQQRPLWLLGDEDPKKLLALLNPTMVVAPLTS